MYLIQGRLEIPIKVKLYDLKKKRFWGLKQKLKLSTQWQTKIMITQVSIKWIGVHNDEDDDTDDDAAHDDEELLEEEKQYCGDEEGLEIIDPGK